MYKSFFGFHERPFKLVPDPAFFFYSPSHEEALAHLVYTIRQGEGFALIIGEVGTGKTTLCRQFLENLEENIDTAYIFNPILEPVDLLKSINSELGISSSGDQPRELINRLNTYLLEKKRQGHRVILIIDEAQSLSFDVLEQLRLLSNLETTRSKLIQIIMVGQPELNKLLGSYKLRQLRQRVSVTYRLAPLTRTETKKYIYYRTSIASGKSTALFSSSAVREIYAFSSGTPRLINIVCDRALLAAFIQNRHRISGKIARAAVKELYGPDDRRPFINLLRLRWLWALFITGLLILVGFLTVPKMLATHNLKNTTFSESSRILIDTIKAPPVVQRPTNPLPPEKNRSDPAMPHLPLPDERRGIPDPASGDIILKELSVVNPIEQGFASQRRDLDSGSTRPEIPSIRSGEITAVDALKRLLADMDPGQSRRAALLAVLKLWTPDPEIRADRKEANDDLGYFQQIAGFNGLEIHRTGNSASLITGMDLPAIMVFGFEDGKRYMACKSWQDDMVVLTDGHRTVAISAVHLKDSKWSGAYIPWRNFLGLAGTIPRNASAETILTLKMLLRKKGFTKVPLTVVYDDLTKGAVEIIQAYGGIPVDGVVGPATKIVIYNNLKEYRTPHIGADPKGLG